MSEGTCPACESGKHDLCQPILNDGTGCDCHHAGHRVSRNPVIGSQFRVTRLDPEGNPTGESFEIKGSMTGRISGEGEHPYLREVEREIPPLHMPTAFESIKMDVQFQEVDPELVALLTGSGDYKPGTLHSLQVASPVKRKWWQWLLRRPREYRYLYLPSVKIGEVSTDGNDPS